jgi:hypothetical protein
MPPLRVVSRTRCVRILNLMLHALAEKSGSAQKPKIETSRRRQDGRKKAQKLRGLRGFA